MPGVIKGVLILILAVLLFAFLWGCSVGIADVIVNGV
jgi:hypothetical protein